MYKLCPLKARRATPRTFSTCARFASLLAFEISTALLAPVARADPVATTAYVYNACNNAAINGLSAANFDGLIASYNQTGQPVAPSGNGRYVLSFDGSQTSVITANINGFQLNGQVFTNQALLTYAMQPTPGCGAHPASPIVNLETIDGPGLNASATATINPNSNIITGSRIGWGDMTGWFPWTGPIGGSHGQKVTHTYKKPGSYTISFNYFWTTPGAGGNVNSATVSRTVAIANTATISPSSVIKGAYLRFDNSVQGKDGNEHYWVYLYLGPGSSNPPVQVNDFSDPPGAFGTFAYGEDNKGGQNYATGHPAAEYLNVGNSTTFSDLVNRGGHLLIDFHGQFGGLHHNSDWKTGVVLEFQFKEGSCIVTTNGPIAVHVDDGKSRATWRTNFSVSANASSGGCAGTFR